MSTTFSFFENCFRVIFCRSATTFNNLTQIYVIVNPIFQKICYNFSDYKIGGFYASRTFNDEAF